MREDISINVNKTNKLKNILEKYSDHFMNGIPTKRVNPKALEIHLIVVNKKSNKIKISLVELETVAVYKAVKHFRHGKIDQIR